MLLDCWPGSEPRRPENRPCDVWMRKGLGRPGALSGQAGCRNGPGAGLPMTEVLQLHGVRFSRVLASLMSSHARRIYGPTDAA